MLTGSPQPNSETDHQCQHCKLYYSYRGISSHEENCPVKDLPFEVVDPQGEDHPEGEESTEDAQVDPGDIPPSWDDVSPEPSASPEVDEDVDVQEETVTDGGSAGLGLSGPPEMPTVDEDDVDDEPETYDCTKCDEDLELTESDLEEAYDGDPVGITCQECGHKMRWTP
jgi:DNA-directed RNA polymerase subunit RPC12/RpoP